MDSGSRPAASSRMTSYDAFSSASFASAAVNGLSADRVPDLLQPLVGYRIRRFELLREERHPQLFEVPAEFLQSRVGDAGLPLLFHALVETLHELRDALGVLHVALGTVSV